jgi:hypothetical protein
MVEAPRGVSFKIPSTASFLEFGLIYTPDSQKSTPLLLKSKLTELLKARDPLTEDQASPFTYMQTFLLSPPNSLS